MKDRWHDAVAPVAGWSCRARAVAGRLVGRKQNNRQAGAAPADWSSEAADRVNTGLAGTADASASAAVSNWDALAPRPASPFDDDTPGGLATTGSGFGRGSY